MSREEKEDRILELCEKHQCPPKKRKVHYDQFVNRGWHPHPPQSFKEWWSKHHCAADEKPIIAFNTKCFYDEWMEARKYGTDALL